MILTLFTFLLLSSSVKADDAAIDYYENLINSEIAKSANYVYPKDATDYRPKNEIPLDFGIFDFVVVGAGSAGAVVASRLSEIKHWNVLLLEAGAEENNFTDIPAMVGHVAKSEYNWGFNTTPQTGCCRATGGVCPYPRGKSLGGSSAINDLMYMRGNAEDYDRWAAEGNPGWAYEDVLPYFIKSENAHFQGDEGYHGYEGELDTNYHEPLSEKVDMFLKANKEVGQSILDYNGKRQIGANRIQYTTRNGRRLSSARAFLTPARNRLNLQILTNSYVTKILISKTNRVWGVEFSRANVKYTVRARKEVVLSAGFIGSSQILMLSGIGPREELQHAGIPAVEDLQVGKGMHDHLVFFNLLFATNHSEPSFTLRTAVEQYLNKAGVLTIAANYQGVAYFNLGLNNLSSPEIEMAMAPSVSRGLSAFNNHLPVKHPKDHFSYYSTPLDNVFNFIIILLHPKTRGEVRLDSSDPYKYPLLDFKCLSDSKNEDIDTVYRGIQTALELVKSDAFKELNPILLPYKNCMGHEISSEHYWKCIIRDKSMNAYHGAGTCKMGPDPKRGAVVNNKLKVYGVSNLRVADTSVIPVSLAAHMNAPAMMIGEKAADIIKEEYLKLVKWRKGT